MRTLVAAAALLGVALMAGAASAAEPWRSVAARSDGFSIAVPASWQVVPRPTKELDALVGRLRRDGRTSLANQFAQIAAVRRASETSFGFQAFAWPPPKGAVVPDVTVKVDRLAAGTTQAALPAIARQAAKALAATSGATVSVPVARTLPAGRALRLTGTLQLSKTLRSRFSLYLLINRERLFSLTFRGPETQVEARIASRLRFLSR